MDGQTEHMNQELEQYLKFFYKSLTEELAQIAHYGKICGQK